MITIFRKIRQSLISENKFKNYLVYAIGEIILVVIGILIALSINTCNQNRINNNKEIYYLNQLKQELTNQNEEINKRLERSANSIKVVDTLLSQLYKDGKFTASSELNGNLFQLIGGTNFKLFRTTFDELISTGQFTLISSDSLRSKILFCYQEIEKSKNDITNNSENVFYKDIFPALNASINFQYPEHISDLFIAELNSPKEQLRLAKAISLNKLNLWSYQKALKDCQDEVTSTIDMIDALLSL
ncbi:DUF6090 family protein [Psychroserpens sp.]|uniref:DUF6090 family protein n=1 Tax=Psychroserpens sp. TaxID=2020870 RepID=UPI001B24AD5C|nr:DUF6090 family protein [Psychroserpens sp.]MBO6607646.1 hypothetical protein [Psychroserpens sp.]MBO6630847.1 hypothetical protein [Psychroserpens sp.]MBO6655042.1 hypothetical protein [Psychroserpens sp.]MBO6683153.1 hypothetical protein [Psychroserpens sp.]MBO6749668.1 hypothetical protein [Psychroserpens sp.]